MAADVAIRLQAMLRGFLVRKTIAEAGEAFTSIAREIEGEDCAIEWNRTQTKPIFIEKRTQSTVRTTEDRPVSIQRTETSEIVEEVVETSKSLEEAGTRDESDSSDVENTPALTHSPHPSCSSSHGNGEIGEEAGESSCGSVSCLSSLSDEEVILPREIAVPSDEQQEDRTGRTVPLIEVNSQMSNNDSEPENEWTDQLPEIPAAEPRVEIDSISSALSASSTASSPIQEIAIEVSPPPPPPENDLSDEDESLFNVTQLSGSFASAVSTVKPVEALAPLKEERAVQTKLTSRKKRTRRVTPKSPRRASTAYPSQAVAIEQGQSEIPLYDRTSLKKRREELALELLWIRQAIESRKEYLRIKVKMEREERLKSSY